MSFPDWTGQTVAALASGPSLVAEDCAFARRWPTIVTNATFRLCPWAQALFGFDLPWWTWNLREVRATFGGLLFCDQPRRGVTNAREHPAYQSFGNSGACAIALAIACGAERVVMLGYDCQLTGGRTHHHGPHQSGLRNCDTLPRWPAQFAALARFVAARGAEVLNASRESALTCFPRVALHDLASLA